MSVEEAKAAVDRDPASSDALYILGLVYFNLHDEEKAGKAFERILSMDDTVYPARWGYAEILRRRHRNAEAEEILEKVIEQDSAFSPAYITLGYIRYIQRDFSGAARLAAVVISQGREEVDTTNYVRAHCLYAGAKGMLAHFGGPFSKAINGAAVMRHLKIAESVLPNEVGVLFGLGSYYMLIPSFFGRDVDRAIEYLENALKVDPFFIDVYVRLAQAYKLQGDMQQYEANMNKALELDPQNPIALDIKNGICNFICVEAPGK
jgi:tetratricopeptide (TPR) repeat protein